MKIFINLSLALLTTGGLYAQSPAVKTPFSQAIETILADFPANYSHITGDLLLSEAELEQYSCTVNLPGAESCIIGHYHSRHDTTASWQAVMFRSEEFEKAAGAYKKIFQDLKKCSLPAVDGSLFYLQGSFEPASEDRIFITSELHINLPDFRFDRFRIQVELLYQIDQWVVNISMMNKKEDSEIGPDIIGRN